MRGADAREQAQAERLTLLVAKNKAGYFGVYLTNPSCPKPYLARVYRGGNNVSLGSFATAEEAALSPRLRPNRFAEKRKRPNKWCKRLCLRSWHAVRFQPLHSGLARPAPRWRSRR